MWKASLLIILAAFAIYGEANPTKKRVCVIGAGMSGLHATRLLSHYPKEFETIVFEKQSDVGGLWIYDESTTVDKHGLPVHSSLYKNMRINVPKEMENLQEYPQFKGDESQGSFVYHTEMLEYLKNYTRHFNLRQYIKFDTNVEHVSPLPGLKWLVATRDLNYNATTEFVCDAVIVANGNNVKGHVPKITGIKSFKGRVIHSHVYRHPEEFTNQTVLILGASFSGIDIGIDVSRFAKKVYLSHRHEKLMIELPTNIEQVLGVVGTKGGELILSDGSRINADSMILCTGYDYDYPFLDRSSGIYVDGDGKWVRSLYKHFLNIERPTMAILNIPSPGTPLHFARVEAAYFIAVLRGKLKLPSRKEMLKDAKLPAGVPKSKAHHMVAEILPLYQELALASGDDLLPDSFIKSLITFLPYLYTQPMHFRQKKVILKTDGTIELV